MMNNDSNISFPAPVRDQVERDDGLIGQGGYGQVFKV
jgi:hypothetical protein